MAIEQVDSRMFHPQNFNLVHSSVQDLTIRPWPGLIFFGKSIYVSSRLVTNWQWRPRAKLATTAVFRNYVLADKAIKGDYTFLLV